MTKGKAFLIGLLVLFAILNINAPATAHTETKCGLSNLPVAVQRAILGEFNTWDIVTINDLAADDQMLWTKKHPDECPGIAWAEFNGRGTPSYAVTLIRRERGKLWQTLVVAAAGRGGKYNLIVLSKPQETAQVSVVEKLPPGRYSNADQSLDVSTRYPVIQYEVIESGAIIYFWKNGRYKSLIASE